LRKFFKRFTSVLLIASLGLSLVACNGGKDKNGVDKNGYGGSVTVGITQEPKSFDPHMVVAAGDEEILFNIFEGLFKYDSTGTLQPCLATDYTVNEEATEYVFTIRDNVKFHNDQEMTMADVIYSYKRATGLLNEGDTALVAELDCVTDVFERDGKLVITLDQSNSEILTYFTTAIIPASVENIGSTPIGTGPFVFDNYTVGVSVTLKRNDNYWQESLPYLDSVVFKILADMNSGDTEIRNGYIDIFPHYTMDKAELLPTESFNILTCPSNMVQIFALNSTFEPFSNPLVREAINYAIDRDALIQLSVDGAGVPLTTAMSPAMGDAYDTSIDGTYSQDIDYANELMEEAGYGDGFDVTITIPSEYLVSVDTTVALVDQLSSIGINATIEQTDWSTWLSDVYAGRNYEATVIFLTSNYSAYDVMSRYETSNSGNFINYSNPEYDEIIAQIPLTTDINERNEMYHELLAILVADNASCYIQDPLEVVAVSSELEGYQVYPMYVQDMSTVRYIASN